MKTSCTLILLLFAQFLSLGQTAQQLKHLEDYLSFRAKHDRYSGITAIYKNDSLLFSSVHGFANRTWEVPNNFNTKFDLASVTKMFTSVGIARLFEEGKIDLNAPFMTYFPEFPLAEARTITVKQLLSHTSGISDFFFDKKYLEYDRSRLRKLEDYATFLEEVSLANVPNNRILYSNTNYIILGRIIEKISGSDYYSYMNKTVFEPLQMKSTGFFEKDKIVPNIAEGYFKDAQASAEFGVPNDGELRSNIALRAIKGMPAGGAYSNAADLHIFMQALENGKLIKKSTFEMFSQAFQGAYGFGFQNYAHNGLQIWGHSGGFYGANTMVFSIPEKEIIFISLTNIDFAAQPVFDHFAGLLTGSDQLILPEKVEAKELKKYEGYYEVVSGEMKGRQIEITAANQKLIFDRNLEFYPIGKNRFFDIDNPGFILEFSQNSNIPDGFIRSDNRGFKQEAKRINASEIKKRDILRLSEKELQEYLLDFQFTEDGMMPGHKPTFSIENGSLLIDNMMRFVPFEKDKFFLYDDVGMVLQFIRNGKNRITEINVLRDGNIVGTLLPAKSN